MARECFLDECEGLLPALIDRPLYVHQERAVRATHIDGRNVVVATGTASGKTESFLYPIETRARTNDEIMPAWSRQTGD